MKHVLCIFVWVAECVAFVKWPGVCVIDDFTWDVNALYQEETGTKKAEIESEIDWGREEVRVTEGEWIKEK